MPNESIGAQVPKFEVPQELLGELQRRGAPKRPDFAIESWQPTVFERLLAILTGRQ